MPRASKEKVEATVQKRLYVATHIGVEKSKSKPNNEDYLQDDTS